MYIRKTEARDVSAAEEIYRAARIFMREAGNPEQWPGEYPGVKEIISDIENGTGYVCCEGEEIVAIFHFSTGEDPTYLKIYGGEWKSTQPYGVIHRIAVKHHGRGVADFIFKDRFSVCGNLKIDTHKDNLPMQKCLTRNGFEYCGIIYLEDGGERLAYQKIR